MNPLNSNSPLNNFQQNQFNNNFQQNQANSQLMNGVHRAKELMQALKGDQFALIQRFPELKPFAQGANLESIFTSMCQAKGIDPNVILNELRS